MNTDGGKRSAVDMCRRSAEAWRFDQTTECLEGKRALAKMGDVYSE
jgi:hypothetical protein